MGQANELWAVHIRDKRDGQQLEFGDHLWVLAKNPTTASSKARRWLKSNNYVRTEITKIESHGTIDVF